MNTLHNLLHDSSIKFNFPKCRSYHIKSTKIFSLSIRIIIESNYM